MSHNKITWILLLALLPYSQWTAAAPLSIYADTVLIDRKNNYGVYSGDILVEQENQTFHAHAITVTHSKDNKHIQLIDITGGEENIIYTRKFEQSKKNIYGHSKQMKYNPLEQTLELWGGAYIKQGNNEFSSDYIKYNISSDVVTADPPQKNAGVKISLEL